MRGHKPFKPGIHYGMNEKMECHQGGHPEYTRAEERCIMGHIAVRVEALPQIWVPSMFGFGRL